MERNRIAAGEVSAAVKRSLEKHLAVLGEEIGETDVPSVSEPASR